LLTPRSSGRGGGGGEGGRGGAGAAPPEGQKDSTMRKMPV